MENNSKNVIIAVLVIIVIGGLGYFIEKNNNMAGTTSDVDSSNQVTVPVPVSPTPPPVVTPDAPVVTTSADVIVSSSTAVVTGKVLPNGAATTYWFDYGETTALGQRTIAQAIGSGYYSTPTPAYITGLRANTTYYFRLSASNRFATVNGITYNFQTNSLPPPSGSAPVSHTVAASDVTRTTATLKGQVNPNASSSNYWFEYGTDANFGSATAIQSAGDGTSLSSVSFPAIGLDPLTKYYFRLNAQNQYGTVNGSTLSFTTKGPAAPAQPVVSTTSATNVTATTALVRGRVNPNGVEANYWFEYSQDSLLGTLIGNGTPAQPLEAGNSSINVDATITGLARNTTYYYRSVAQNQYGTIRGSIVSFKTRP